MATLFKCERKFDDSHLNDRTERINKMTSTNSLIAPIEDVHPRYHLSLSWFDQQRPAGISFIIRARDEERTVEEAIMSVRLGLGISFPYEIVLVNNCSSDRTQKIGEHLQKEGTLASLVHYPFQLAKPGLENYVTSVDSVHSIVWFYQFCWQQARFKYIFKWDADFVMTRGLADRLKTLWNEEFDTCRVPAVDFDGVANCEPYLFNTLKLPVVHRHQYWETTSLLIKGGQAISLDGTGAVIEHASQLKTMKPYYRLPPWWEGSDSPVASVAKREYEEFSLMLPIGIQLFTRASDPACDTLCRSVGLLPYREGAGKLYTALKERM